MTKEDIQERINADCNGIWEPLTIYKFLPSWIHNQNQVKGAKKAWETKHAKQVEKVKNIFTSITQETLPEPKIVEIEQLAKVVINNKKLGR